MGARKTYHHGNLREALVEAALALIEQSGPQSFSLAEAARRAGVSAAAPYRHYKGRDDLLEEVARRGFAVFTERMEAAFDKGRPTPLEALARIGDNYLDFAWRHKGYYMAMFESGIDITSNSALYEANEKAIAILVRATEALYDAAPRAERPPARLVANHIWALSHGVVELFARAGSGARTPFSAEDILGSGVLLYLRGLGLVPR